MRHQSHSLSLLKCFELADHNPRNKVLPPYIRCMCDAGISSVCPNSTIGAAFATTTVSPTAATRSRQPFWRSIADTSVHSRKTLEDIVDGFVDYPPLSNTVEYRRAREGIPTFRKMMHSFGWIMFVAILLIACCLIYCLLRRTKPRASSRAAAAPSSGGDSDEHQPPLWRHASVRNNAERPAESDHQEALGGISCQLRVMMPEEMEPDHQEPNYRPDRRGADGVRNSSGVGDGGDGGGGSGGVGGGGEATDEPPAYEDVVHNGGSRPPTYQEACEEDRAKTLMWIDGSQPV